MQITYLSLALYFLFIYAGFDGAFAGTNFKYIRSGDLEGHTCPADQTIFEDKGSVACLSMCSEISTCFGVFRQPQNSHCLGCKDRFLTSDKAPLLNGTQYYRRQTYRFVEEGKTWYEAKNYCEKLGGRLADIQTIEEEKFIEGNVISADDKEIWLGATDEENEGTFLWQDGTKVSDAYDNWGPNQPNGVNFGAVAHCMQFWFEGGKWTWNDAACSKYIPSVCEFY